MASNDGGRDDGATLDQVPDAATDLMLLDGDGDDFLWRDTQAAPGAVATSAASARTTAAVSPGSDAAFQSELAYVGGIAATGAGAASSFWTANGDVAHKWQTGTGTQATGGTAGGTVTYYFDPNSHWSAAEMKSFTGGMALWSAEANVTFAPTSNLAAASVVITRGTDGGAHTAVAHTAPSGSGAVSRDLGVDQSGRHTNISIDTSAVSFSQLDSFSAIGGYGIASVIHEEGHLLGLGHGGNYNGTVSPASQQNGVYDSRLWSVMSYIRPDDATASDYGSYPVSGTSWGTTADHYYRAPYTPMPLDILAAQRLYGAPTSTLLSGGQVFGFHTNVDPSIRDYFDFTVDTAPVVTLFDTGRGNTLDLSGYGTDATIDLRDGHFSSFAGLTNNLGIAFGTEIDDVVGTQGRDTIVGNGFANVFTGGAAQDTFTGGGGADIYRDTAADLAGSIITDFIAADTIDVTDAAGAVSGLAFAGGILSFMVGATAVSMTLQGITSGAFTARRDTTGGGGVDIVYDPAAPTRTAPPAPTVALAPASDTGASNADGITARTSVTVTGAATAGDTVTVFDDADRDGVQDGGEVTLGTAVAAAGAGSYAMTIALSPGQHSLRAVDTDPSTGLASAASAAASVTVDTTAPTTAAAAVTVAGNAGPTAIGIAAPQDDATPSMRLAIAIGALPTDGSVTLADGTPVTAGEALTAAQLGGLLFAPAADAFDRSSTLAYTVTDLAGNVGGGSATLSIATQPATPVPPTPSPSVTVVVPPIAVLPTPAIVGPPPPPIVAVPPIAVPPTPAIVGPPPPPIVAVPPIAVPPTPAIAGPAPPPAVSAPPVDAVTIDPTVLRGDDGGFTLSGRARSTAGVAGVELSGIGADGNTMDLGPATLGDDGTFTATVYPGARGMPPQGIVAIETDKAGGTARSAAPFSLKAGGSPAVAARQDTFDPADGSPVSSTMFKRDGSRVVQVLTGGQTLQSAAFDTFKNGGNPDTTFVFEPGHGLDIVGGFRLGGADHDTLSLPASDYTSIAEVLRDTRSVQGGVVIADPTSGDSVRLVGVTKPQLVQHRDDFALHA